MVVTSKTRASKSVVKKKKQNLLKIYGEMSKLSTDAVDREVLKRFKIIIDTCDDDITKALMRLVLKEPKNVTISVFHESVQPYIKHFIFLMKRELKRK
jgi:hypothetical protein